VPTTLALVGAGDTDRDGRSSPSLAQASGDLPERGDARHEADSPDPITVILTFGNEMEDTKWRSVSNAWSSALGALCKVATPTCQVRRISISDSHLCLGHS
jgi:hypothetical protein